MQKIYSKFILRSLIILCVVNNVLAERCPSGDPDCLSPGSNQRATTQAPKGNMAVFPRTYRSDGSNQIDNSNPADAVLAQTSYLARVMIQANDIFPPSHVSTRGSGETYASTIVPLEYNLKALTQVATYRNALGATSTSQSTGASSTGRTNINKVTRDWVEYHIAQYCDPLAGSVGSNGLRNCNSVLNGLDSTSVAAAKEQGSTSWDLVAKRGMAGPYAADITATTLFNSKIMYPEAAMRFIYNVTNALPQTIGNQTQNPKEYKIPDEYLASLNGEPVLKDEGYDVYLKYMETQSKISLSQYALMAILSERMKIDNIKVPVTKWDNSGNKKVEFEPTSRHGLLKFEANKRFQDPAWYDRVQQMPTPALLKEISYMLAMQNSLDFKRYEQQQTQTALLASLATDMASLSKVAKQFPSPAENANAANNIMNDYQNQINQIIQDRLQ